MGFRNENSARCEYLLEMHTRPIFDDIMENFEFCADSLNLLFSENESASRDLSVIYVLFEKDLNYIDTLNQVISDWSQS